MGFKALIQSLINNSLAVVKTSIVLLLLSGCTTVSEVGTANDKLALEPELLPITAIRQTVRDIPSPTKSVDIAVYAYQDKTGQNQPEDDFARFSRAVTQGGEAVLIDVLKETGKGTWFNVVERSGFNNLINERKIIDATRKQYLNASSNLPPLRFAGIILEGGIIDYDVNQVTGGAGARYLGIGASTQYRRDIINVSLRAVSVGTGEVLTSVTTSKTIYSVLLTGSVFKFVALDELLELEAGVTKNEPAGFAVRQAIELAVYSLITEGLIDGIWKLKNQQKQNEMIESYEGRYKTSNINTNTNG